MTSRGHYGPTALLRDLELRLGLPHATVHELERVEAWSRRLASRLDDEPFYAASYRADPLGTARMLLGWRDALVDAGWDGEPIDNGGRRLDAFAALATTPPDLPAGAPDRLAAAEHALARQTASPYASITIADDSAAWPQRWQRVVRRLQELGTELRPLELAHAGAPAGTDLHALQECLRSSDASPPPVQGDGSIVLLRAPTAVEAADAATALLAAWRNEHVVVIRGGEHGLLDGALRAQGLPPMGVRRHTHWRATLQLLPLALELAFDPSDAHRAAGAWVELRRA